MLNLKPDLMDGIGSFLAGLPVETLKRGRDYHSRGSVQGLRCEEPERCYVAAVRGLLGDHDVKLEYVGDRWKSTCSCPVEINCKHGVAAILDLRQKQDLVTIKPGPQPAVKLHQSLIQTDPGEHAGEISRWQDWFRSFDQPRPDPETGSLELRLRLLPDCAYLQWRIDPGIDFADFNQVQAKLFSTRFDRGLLVFSPESLSIWSALYKPWHYESWWSLNYDNASARPALNRLLRLTLAPDRIVTPDNQPLRRVAEPLRFKLFPPEPARAFYKIALVAADGSVPPRPYCTLTGQPTLYLTERGLFAGPAAAAPDGRLTTTIPARALETGEGVGFLRSRGIPLPEALARRVRTVPSVVTISCHLPPEEAAGESREIRISVVARTADIKAEKFTIRGWTPLPDPGGAKKTPPVPGEIQVCDRSAHRHFPHLLDALGARWIPYPGEWSLRLTKKTPELFAEWLRSLPPEVKLLLDRELASLRDEPVSGCVSLDVAESGMDWFDLKVVLKVSDTTLTEEELKLLLNAKGGYVRLGEKGWRRLLYNLTPEEDGQLARLGLNARDFSAEPQRLHALQLADEATKKFLPPERVEKIQRRVSEIKTRVTPAQPQNIRAQLRPYQTEGYHFLAYLTANRFGGVLADDMGLGKTLQTLSWLAWLRGQKSEDAAARAGSAIEISAAPQKTKAKAAPARLPSLVVCPKSVMDNWRAETERFYSSLRVRVWRGEPAAELPDARENSDLIVINYAQLRFLSPAIGNMAWHAVILDEAQYIKNPDSQTSHAARALKAGHRLALTGTPIENRLLDLWSIFSFAMPGVLGNRAHFLRSFNDQNDPLARRRLAARVRPFLLRRTKTQVAKDLPDRVEEDLLCEMEGPQKNLYRAELKRARQLILGLKSDKQLNSERFHILTSLLRLRQICCHPALVDQTLHAAESAKVSALLDLLEPLMAEGHKVLVFSQFVTMLDLLRDTIKERQWPHFYLAGDTENRGDLVKEFQSAPGGAVFLISLKAGGFGLNLTAASYVVLFDPWWNPAVENQAIDRTHRIGQTSKVMAYRMLMKDSIEQKIRALQKQKSQLMEGVLGEERFSQSLTLKDLQFLFAE